MKKPKHSAVISRAVSILAVGTMLGFVSTSWAQENRDTLVAYNRQFTAVAQDTKAQQFVMFGGFNNGPTLDDTWVWNGEWKQEMPTRHPLPRMMAAIAYDSGRDETVIFGGRQDRSELPKSTPWVALRSYPPSTNQEGAEAEYRDTWTWNGEDWTQRLPPHSPSVRYSHAMAYDSAHKQIVLFGGYSDVERTALNDTWVWNGTDWKKMSPANVPPARYWHAMAYDTAHQQIVMFGGKDTMGHDLDDTWLWDGSNWTNVQPSGELPEPRFEHGMIYDSRLEKVLLISGNFEDASRRGSPLSDTWAWDGSSWTKLPAKQFDLILEPPTLSRKDVLRTLIVTESAQIAYWVPRLNK
jgi:hypothetical protein